ncbi:hypothetical protein ACFSHP_09270 [Novosphingobium panipatense]
MIADTILFAITGSATTMLERVCRARSMAIRPAEPALVRTMASRARAAVGKAAAHASIRTARRIGSA